MISFYWLINNDNGSYLNRLNKLTIFHIFILSNFNFCPLAWHFCTDKNSKKLEKVQERALRFVYEDYNSSYEELLQKAKVPSLTQTFENM
jgi:hypothetical protein